MIFDIHSHVIPNVDDGSSGIEESIALLRELKNQGVEKVLATPHFYASRLSIDSYVEKISVAFHKLKERTEGMELPELLCGSEVYFFKGISTHEDLHKLCINSTKYIMVELPYRTLDRRIEDELNDIAINRGLIPILAHCDRYLKYNSFDTIARLFRYGDIEGQVNADALCQGLGKRKALQFIKGGYCAYLGSDAHNMTTRPPRIADALAYVERKLGPDAVDQLSSNASKLYHALTEKQPAQRYL